MDDIGRTITILSSMITPVVLILASGSLIISTSQRLGRVVERTRKLTDAIKELIKNNSTESTLEQEVSILFEQLQKSAKRAKLLQRAMGALYITLSIFVATSISIGVIDIYRKGSAWIPVILGILGAMLMLYASILLIKESRIALNAVNKEMDTAIRFVFTKFPGLKK
ncbi:MAG: DUF2721 domain-containing protein [Chitinophagaceae bacterium]|nr:DUF2721 domain-containing protein [Chitinophagaceae bacterium]